MPPPPPPSPNSANTSIYEAWVRDHSADLFRFARRLTGTTHLAEELVQDTFLQAWKSRHDLLNPDAARPWLFTILRHQLSRITRKGKLPTAPDDTAAINLPATTPSPADTIADRDALQKGINALDEPTRLAFVTVFVQGLTCQEAATTLNVPIGTILSRIHRARTQLRTALTSSPLPSPPRPEVTRHD